MKKIILLLVLIFSFPLTFLAAELKPMDLEESLKDENISYDLSNYSYGENKVNIYLFRGSGCSHCRDFLEFVSTTLIKDYSDYFNLVSYEVWYNKENDNLKTLVMQHFNVTKSGVPFIVIGDKYYIGFGSSRGQDIIDTLMEEYNKSERIDVVKNIIDEQNSVKNEEENLDKEQDKNKEEKDEGNEIKVNQGQKFTDKYDIKELLLIGFVIVVCVSILVVLFIIFGPKRKK